MNIDMNAVYETSKALIASDDVNDVLAAVIRCTLDALTPYRVTLIRADLSIGKVLNFVSGGDDTVDKLEITFDELWDGLGGLAMRERTTLYSPDPYTEERESRAVRDRRLHSNSGPLIVAPMIFQDKVLGVLTAINLIGDPEFSEEQIALVEVIANLSAAAIEMAALREKTHEAAKLKSQFMANVSHEIRTPLNGILGMVELMGQTALSQKQQYFLQTIEVSSEQLLTLVNDILDFAAIDTGRITVGQHHIALRAIVAKVVSEFQPTAHHKGLDLQCHISSQVPETVVGDESRLQQVLLHLLGNAIKFTPAGTVAVQVDRELNGVSDNDSIQILFRIKDTGIGITAEQQKLIFETFAQVDGTMTREQGGIGMGLAITRRLVDMMEGRITVQSSGGGGTEFTVILPFRLPWCDSSA